MGSTRPAKKGKRNDWLFCVSVKDQVLGERQTEFYPPLASLDPPGGRVKSLSLWESRPERPERVDASGRLKSPAVFRYDADELQCCLNELFRCICSALYS